MGPACPPSSAQCQLGSCTSSCVLLPWRQGPCPRCPQPALDRNNSKPDSQGSTENAKRQCTGGSLMTRKNRESERRRREMWLGKRQFMTGYFYTNRTPCT